jgi:phosphatidylserine synthase
MRRVSPLPSLLTLGNLSSGFVAIVLCAQSLYWRTEPEKVDALVGWACACVFFGMLFDMLGGWRG